MTQPDTDPGARENDTEIECSFGKHIPELERITELHRILNPTIVRGKVSNDLLALLKHIDAYTEQQNAKEVIEIIEPLIDEDDCDFDHNHSCQAHGFFYLKQGELCPQEAAKRFIVQLTKLRDRGESDDNRA